MIDTTAKTPTTTPAAMAPTFVLLPESACLLGVAAPEDCAASPGRVITTVLPGAMLVTTDGLAVVRPGLCVCVRVDCGADVDVDVAGGEDLVLELLLSLPLPR